MKPFFVFSHLGLNIDLWNAFLSSHKRVQSNYSPDQFKIYENSDLNDNMPKVNKWYFSKAKWYDILLHNYQVGFKKFYEDYPCVIIFGSPSVAQNNITNHRVMEKSFAKNYTQMRIKRLLYICNHAIKPLVFIDGFSPVDVMKQMLCDFLDIPNEFNSSFTNQQPETLDLQTLEYLYDLDLSGKIKLAVK